MGEGEHWFEPVADHLGAAYLRYSFTRGTRNEVDFLWDVLGLRSGSRVLDVGCGPGRHAHELARRGADVLGVDISQRFVDLAAAAAPPGARFERADARTLGIDAAFDAAISLCQGAFGLVGGPLDGGEPLGGGAPVDPDGVVLERMARAVRPGGLVAVSAFSAYFAVRYLEEQDTFDTDRGVNHERTSVRSETGDEAEIDLWTSCFTPRELRLLALGAGLVPEAIWSVTPGDYARRAPTLDRPELLLLARRPDLGL